MARVSDDWNANFCFILSLGILMYFARHSDLVAGCHAVEPIVCADVSQGQTWSQRIYIKEWIFPVLDIGNGRSIK
jgi:hypothetical protein